jgi:hypothetical protein
MGNLEGPLYKKVRVPASFHFVTAASGKASEGNDRV